MKLSITIWVLALSFTLSCSASRSAPSPQSNTVAMAFPTATPEPVDREKARCTLDRSHAPVIEGVRLGMSTDEVLALFPGSKDDVEVTTDLARPRNAYGGSQLVIRPLKYKPADKSKTQVGQINRINLAFLDGQVMTFNVGYEGPAWSHVDDFVKKLAAEQNLPEVNQWEAQSGLDNQLKTIACTEFSVNVFAGGEGGNLNHVIVQDLEAEKKLKERRKKAREQASPNPGQ